MWKEDRLITFTSNGLLLLVGFGSSRYIPLKIVVIASGEVLSTHHYPVALNKKVEFVEMLQDKLLVKQEGRRLQILNVSTLNIKVNYIFTLSLVFKGQHY